MNDARSAADKVRPILQAMERSIATARQRRLNQEDRSADVTPQTTPLQTQETQTGDQEVPRLRARPKRPSSLTAPPDSTYRSQAG
jgi:hypothetical protein